MRPNLAYTISFLSQIPFAPKEEHLIAVKQVLKNLKKTLE